MTMFGRGKDGEGKTSLPLFAEGIVTPPPYAQNPPQLWGGWCEQCTQYYFPRPRYCRLCLEPTARITLGAEGTIYSYTVIRTKAPLGLPLPYGVGYIDLKGSGLRIFCLLDPAALEQLKVGQAVRLAVGPLGHDHQGAPCLRPYFTPVK